MPRATMQRRKMVTAAAAAQQHLSLRGGGVPILPTITGAVIAGTALTLKLNEGLREKVMDFLEDIKDKLPLPGKQGAATKKPLRRTNAIREDPMANHAPIKEGYDVRNGYATIP